MSKRQREDGQREDGQGDGRRPIVYCLVPHDLAGSLHDPLVRHFRDDPRVEVIIERRNGERRRAGDRRSAKPPARQRKIDRRLIRSPGGRRIGERRVALVPIEAPELPRRARRHAERIAFAERVEPGGRQAEDLDTARLVTRFQAGDRDAFDALYRRYFDRVYTYMRIALNDVHEAEDAAQEVFIRVLEALPRYERRRQPFRGWLFTVVRNYALTEREKLSRAMAVDPAELNDYRDRMRRDELDETELEILNWISDREMVMFIGKLPMPQRQALVLRFMLGFPNAEIARILGTSQVNVRSLHHRALLVLEKRLTATGRKPESGKPESGKPAHSSRWVKQAPVIRHRRFALDP